MSAPALELPGIVFRFQSWQCFQVDGDYTFGNGLLVGLEKFEESSTVLVSLPIGGEKFAAEGLLLRLTAIAEIQQCCI